MAKYRVGIYYEESGTVTIEASSEAEAQKKAEEILAESGLDELELKVYGREYGSTSAEKIDTEPRIERRWRWAIHRNNGSVLHRTYLADGMLNTCWHKIEDDYIDINLDTLEQV